MPTVWLQSGMKMAGLGPGMPGSAANSATGGTITTVGADKVHTFTSDGTFTPNQAFNVRVLVIAGGGGGGGACGGDGGAGVVAG